MTRHLRTYSAPRFWPIRIKEHAFTIRPASGPHPLDQCIPLGILLRDVLGLSDTVSECKRILSEGKVFVDGNVRTDFKFPVGLMDVIYLKPSDSYFRMLPHSLKKLALIKIDSEEASFKLVRITGKRLLKDKIVQLNLHDGRSLGVKVDDPFNIQMNYRVMDTLKVSIPEIQVLETLPLEADAFVSVIGGTRIGKYGTLMETPEKRSSNKLANVRVGDAETTVTLKYIFPIGKGSPIINISGEVA